MRKSNIFFRGVLVGILLTLPFKNFGQSTNNTKDSTNKQYTIENCVNEYALDKADKTKSGYRYWFADKDFIDGRTLKLSVVSPNQATHPPHEHEVDEFFFVLEGKAKIYMDGKSKVVGPYTSLYCPRHVAHGISNAGDTELKYLVIKKYAK